MLWFIIRTLIVGLLAGYAAAKLNHMDTSDWKKNLLLGVAGSFLGGFLGTLIGIKSINIIGSVLISIIGACLVIWLARKIG